MPSWIQRASLLLLFLLSFDTSSLVFGAPQQPPTRLARQLKPLGAETNAKRFAMGLPPLPAMRRGSGTDTARRSTTSDIQTVAKKIQVTRSDTQTVIGYLRLPGGQPKYGLTSLATAPQFQTTLFTTGGTSQINLLNLNAPAATPYLAGLVDPGNELTSTNGNSVILGGASPSTSQGSTPQSSGTTSIGGNEYETAIWNYSASSAITPSWVNHDGSTPSISIVWDPVYLGFHLTANPSAILSTLQNSFIVTFSFV